MGTKVQLNLPANKREQLLFVLVMAALFFVFLRMVYSPQGIRLGQVKKQVQSLTFERDTLRQISLPPAEDKTRTLSSKKGVKMKILAGDIDSPYREVSLLLARLTEPAFLGGVSLKDLSYEPPQKSQGYDRTDFKMKVRGSFPEVLRYVEKMEEFPALFSLESVTIQTVEGQPQEIESDIIGRFFRIEDALRQTVTQGGGKS